MALFRFLVALFGIGASHIIVEVGQFIQKVVQRKSRKKRTMRLNIHGLIDHAKCYQMVRQLRCPEGVEYPHCHATEVVKNGHDEKQSDQQRYLSQCRNTGFRK